MKAIVGSGSPEPMVVDEADSSSSSEAERVAHINNDGLLKSSRIQTLGAIIIAGIGYVAGQGTAPSAVGHSVSKPVLAGISIASKSHSQPMRNKYVATTHADETVALNEISRSDLCRYEFDISNVGSSDVRIDKAGLLVDYADWQYFSSQSDGELKCSDDFPDGYLICNLGDPTTSAGSYIPVQCEPIKLVPGESTTIRVWFQTDEADFCRVLALVGAFFVELEDGQRFFTDPVTIEIHPDSLDVRYGVPPGKRTRRSAKPVATVEQ